VVADVSSSSTTSKMNRKRKRQTAEESSDKHQVRTISASSKKKEHNKHKEAMPVNVQSKERKGGIDESISKMDGRLLADYFMQKARRHSKELIVVELNDLHVPGENWTGSPKYTTCLGDTRECGLRISIIFGAKGF
jgi:protein CMS1